MKTTQGTCQSEPFDSLSVCKGIARIGCLAIGNLSILIALFFIFDWEYACM
jgi:hypothetical protein